MMMSASESAVMVVVMAVMATTYVHGRGANVSGAGEVASSAVSSPAAVLVSRCCVAAAVGPRGPGWSAAHFWWVGVVSFEVVLAVVERFDDRIDESDVV
ncbi:uncharacterized protein BKA78DRAFT_301765 [Phyllosticta capitalensis]|uniref:uncharacterized protein n=1 Tax=Phyllosticta capitalensis TaxID=121624 RepID=UPI00312F7F02